MAVGNSRCLKFDKEAYNAFDVVEVILESDEDTVLEDSYILVNLETIRTEKSSYQLIWGRADKPSRDESSNIKFHIQLPPFIPGSYQGIRLNITTYVNCIICDKAGALHHIQSPIHIIGLPNHPLMAFSLFKHLCLENENITKESELANSIEKLGIYFASLRGSEAMEQALNMFPAIDVPDVQRKLDLLQCLETEYNSTCPTFQCMLASETIVLRTHTNKDVISLELPDLLTFKNSVYPYFGIQVGRGQKFDILIKPLDTESVLISYSCALVQIETVKRHKSIVTVDYSYPTMIKNRDHFCFRISIPADLVAQFNLSEFSLMYVLRFMMSETDHECVVDIPLTIQ